MISLAIFNAQSLPIFKILLVFAGGGLGAVLRFTVSSAAKWFTHGRDVVDPDDSALALVPVGTLAVNVIGCLLIGLAMPMLHGVRDEVRLALVVGVLGGFTTFSAFGHETIGMIDHGRPLFAVWYVVTSVALGLGAVVSGHMLASRWVGEPLAP